MGKGAGWQYRPHRHPSKHELLPVCLLLALDAGFTDAGHVLHIGHVGAFATGGHVYLLGLNGLSGRIGGAVAGFLART